MNFKSIPIIIILLLLCAEVCGQKLQLDISGKNILETQLLNSIPFTKFHESEAAVYREIDSIQTRLYHSGFFQNTIDSVIKKDTLFYAYIYLGKKIEAIKAKVNTRYLHIMKTLEIEISHDSIVVKPEAFAATLDRIAKQFEADGDPFAEIQFMDIQRKDQVLTGKLSIVQTMIRRLDNIFVKGYDKFPRYLIRGIGKIKKGEIFNKNEITRKTQQLDQLPYIKQIKPPEVLFSKDSTELYLYFEKVNVNYFDGFIGFATGKETQQLQLNGDIDIQLWNNLNRAEALTIHWKNNGEDQRVFRADVTIPYLFKSPLGVNAAIHILKQDSTFTNTTTTLALQYNFNTRSRLGVGVENTDSAPVNTAQGNENNYTAFFVKSSYRYSIHDKTSLIFKEKMQLNIAFSMGNRTSDSRVEQQKVYADVGYEWRLNYRHRIYLRNRTEALFSEDYRNGEKYRIGGINTIRGYNENSLEATFYNSTNSEYRILLSKSLSVNSIFDIAYLVDRISGTENTLFGFGLGFGIITSGGLLKINYALGKFEGSPIRFSDAKIHLSFSALF